MIKSILLVLFLSNQSFAFDCKKEAPVKNASEKVICYLEQKEEILEIVQGKKAFEFPEGHFTDCHYLVSCKKEGPSRLSSIVFMKDKDAQTFCETPEEIDLDGVKKKGRILVKSSSDKAFGYILCDKKKIDTIFLKIGSEQKSCAVKLK